MTGYVTVGKVFTCVEILKERAWQSFAAPRGWDGIKRGKIASVDPDSWAAPEKGQWLFIRHLHNRVYRVHVTTQATLHESSPKRP